MKFTAQFPLDSLDLLNLRRTIIERGCRHCHEACQIRAHGYLYGYAEHGHAIVARGLRFFAQTADRI